MILKSIAIDDEILALNKIKRFISKIDIIKLDHVFDSSNDAIKYLENNEVDLIFLDVEMPEMGGFDFLKHLKHKPFIIMTTAFEHYALKSYDFSVNDYLLKPMQFERFLKAVEKVYKLAQNNSGLASNDNKTNENNIFVKSSGKVIKILIDDILYIEGMKDYLAIYLTSKRVVTLMSFHEILDKLPLGEFIRTHKSFIVAKSKIDQINTNDLLVNGKSIPISRTYKSEITLLKNYLI